ncbi:MAG: phytase [Calditrichaeota bacterium]|nr:MAG: phytase [Calditrichota bacterium]
MNRYALFFLALFAFLALALLPARLLQAQIAIPSQVTLADPDIEDQDDMCIWIHPSVRSLSTIIASDKAANKLFVYDLQGQTIQKITLDHKPGNIDIRYNFPLGGQKVDLVVYNDRTHNKIRVYRVEAATRHLIRVDNDQISSPTNYGLCLYHSAVSGKFYAFTTAKNGTIGQIELFETSGGQVGGTLVRQWDIGGQTEGCVCDDETGLAYFGEEDVGIWKVGAEPGDPTSGTLVAQVDDGSGLTADVEGLTIYFARGGTGYLMASSQGNDQFVVYQRQAPHAPVAMFQVSGVEATDGIDVINLGLGPDFPWGLFAAHNGRSAPYPIELCAFQDIGLPADTGYWNPRRNPVSTGIEPPSDGTVPGALTLQPNFPNPFNPSTTIRYRLPGPARIRLSVFTVSGQRVATLFEGQQSAGWHQVVWNGRNSRGQEMASGVYLYRLEPLEPALGSQPLVGKMILLR